MGRLARILVYPIKSLDPAERDRVGVTPIGGLAGDRAYAIVDDEGEYVNGKRTDAVHRIRASFDHGGRVVALRVEGEEAVFDLAGNRAEMAAWLSSYFGMEVRIEATTGGGFTDSSAGAGPTVIARATLEEVASWFDGLDADDVLHRLRPNLVVEGVPAFWEDRLVGSGENRARVGDVTLVGEKPVPRCVVPTRDPHTGEAREGFRERFLERREATFPEWADREAFEHLYSLMTVTRIPEADRGQELAVGDAVEVD